MLVSLYFLSQYYSFYLYVRCPWIEQALIRRGLFRSCNCWIRSLSFLIYHLLSPSPFFYCFGDCSFVYIIHLLQPSDFVVSSVVKLSVRSICLLIINNIRCIHLLSSFSKVFVVLVFWCYYFGCCYYLSSSFIFIYFVIVSVFALLAFFLHQECCICSSPDFLFGWFLFL